ncbi:MAG: DUF4123 domain-containing protein [Bryobacterales bacterium]|nr:DUF4123 domain-containing protein [Bryobacterales bacterium]
MKLILEIIQGQDAGSELEIPAGETRRIGKDSGLSDVSFSLDPAMSLVHCVIGCDDGGGHVRDLNSMAGTWVNGQRVTQARLKAGDHVKAGDTIFVARIQDDAPAEASAGAGAGAGSGDAADDISPENAANARERLLAFLKQEPLTLYALLDGAQSGRIVRMLSEQGAEAQSLLETVDAPELHDVAPYLVQFHRHSKLLPTVIEKGWGQNWGVFLTSAETFSQLRLHLKRLLDVETEDGTPLYFRYYDPRVLRVFLPTCTAEESRRFFGPVDRFIVEENAESALYFVGGPKPQLVKVSLKNPEPAK